MTLQDDIDYEGYCPICQCYFDERCKHYDFATGRVHYSEMEKRHWKTKGISLP